ncbi:MULTISPECIES: hypothetical protein [unclassified Nocardioides]|uniref:hypothetical protein n=1 Tax=unclassified Nocardioides TaxID=2615069 RepID=UPI000A499D83|nr:MULTISPECIES: hypothetical protein [unclassified Nocardioides]
MSEKPTTLDEYVDGLPPRARERMIGLRTLARSTAPELSEALKWGPRRTCILTA